MSSLVKRNSIKEYFIVGGLVLCVIAGMTFLCPPHYSMNDDVMMKSILSGAYTGTPDGHTVYMKYPLSGIISLLYRITGSISWFDVVMVGCFWLSITSVIIRVVKSHRVMLIGGITGLCFALFLPHLLTMHYTLVAAMGPACQIMTLLWVAGAILMCLKAPSVHEIVGYRCRKHWYFLWLAFLLVWSVSKLSQVSKFIYFNF